MIFLFLFLLLFLTLTLTLTLTLLLPSVKVPRGVFQIIRNTPLGVYSVMRCVTPMVL